MSHRYLLICTALLAAAQTEPVHRTGSQLVQVGIKDLQFERRADKWVAGFDLGLALETGKGEPIVAVSPTNLSLTDEQLRKGLAGGLIIDNNVPAPGKAATLRVVVQDKTSGIAGSVRIPLPAK